MTDEPARQLWPIERDILEIAATEYPASADAIRRQAATARVVRFENSGAGFFSYLSIDNDTLPVVEKSPLDVAHGDVDGVEHGMGFIVFLQDHKLSFIEAGFAGPRNERENYAAAFLPSPASLARTPTMPAVPLRRPPTSPQSRMNTTD